MLLKSDHQPGHERRLSGAVAANNPVAVTPPAMRTEHSGQEKSGFVSTSPGFTYRVKVGWELSLYVKPPTA